MCEICTNQEYEKAYEALKLNGDASSIYNQNMRLLSASAIARKPILFIKRAAHSHSPYNVKLRFASSPEQLKKEREKAEKAMNLNYGF